MATLPASKPARRTGRAAASAAGALLGTLVLAALSLPAHGQTRAATPPPVLGPSQGGSNGPAWLNRLLDALTPSVDTSLPESTRAASERLSQQIGNGEATQALDEIERRMAADKQKAPQSTDVQLMFLKARALAQLGRQNEAREVYRQMTEQFPELPEPWNNLAGIEVANGQLEQAKTALEMALRTDPNYSVAKENLGDLYMMLAARTYEDARKLDPQTDVQAKRDGIKSLLDNPAQPGNNRMAP